MAKRYRAQHIVVFAVYRKFNVLGQVGRTFEIAFPDLCLAESYVDDRIKEGYEKDTFMVEEMPAIMKAWQP